MNPHRPEWLRRAAREVVEVKPEADSDDVLVYATALRRAAVGARRRPPQ